MPYVFYQNMQNLRGGVRGQGPARLRAFRDGLTRIRAGLEERNNAHGVRVNHVVTVAAFTEILKNDEALLRDLLTLAPILNDNLTHRVVTFIGKTLGNRVEYVGIAWDNNAINVEHFGQVMFAPDLGLVWQAFNTPAGNAHQPEHNAPVWLIDEPTQYSLDQRGWGYIAGHHLGNPCIFVFGHNQYLNVGQISTLLNGLDTSVRAILRELNNQQYGTHNVRDDVWDPVDNLQIIFGCDFNFEVSGLAWGRLARRGLRPLQAVDENGRAIPTRTNAIDWWVVNQNVGAGNANCEVWRETQGDWMSDHKGISLQY
jgi:hypothetical protein